MDNEQTNLIYYTSMALDLPLDAGLDEAALENAVAQHVQQLIDTNFNALVQLLYRLDVSEELLQQLLLEAPLIDASTHIARLVVARQLQKLQSRRAHTASQNPNIPEHEKW